MNMNDLFNFRLDDEDSSENEFELKIEETKLAEPKKLIYQKQKTSKDSVILQFITSDVGTIGYASPEQLAARSQDFDE